jgi:hypothetical protein
MQATTVHESQIAKAAQATRTRRSVPPRPRATQRDALEINGVQVAYDPVVQGVVTAQQVAAARIYEAARKAAYRDPVGSAVSGAADFDALHTRATLNYSWPVGSHIRSNSIRYWWLVAFHEAEWVELRGRCGDGDLMPHEQVGAALSAACYAMQATLKEYEPYSRLRWRHAMRAGDDKTADEIAIRIVSPDHAQDRRRILLAGRRKHGAALRKVLSLIGEYRRARSRLDGVER